MSNKQEKPESNTANKIIHFLAKDGVVAQLVFIKKDKDGINTSYIDLIDATVNEIRIICQSFMKRRERWKHVIYGEQLDDERNAGIYRTIDIAKIPNKNNIFKKPLTLEKKISEELGNVVKWIGFRFELSNKKPVLFLKKISSNYFVINEHKRYHMVRGGVASLFEGNLIKFPGDFDLVTFDNTLLIFNIRQFEDLFEFHILHEQNRQKVFDHIRNEADYEIEQLDFFESVIKLKKYHLRKFGPIIDKQIYIKTVSELKKLLKARTVKTLKIKDKKMTFVGATAFIDFFNDNYLSSYFTKRDYTAHSKTQD